MFDSLAKQRVSSHAAPVPIVLYLLVAMVQETVLDTLGRQTTSSPRADARLAYRGCACRGLAAGSAASRVDWEWLPKNT